MAVYTEISNEDLSNFVRKYDIGDTLSAEGIVEGVENSNYLLKTTSGSFILTLYEKRVNPEDLPFFLCLKEHLAARGLYAHRHYVISMVMYYITCLTALQL